MALINFSVVVKGFYKDEKGCYRRGELKTYLNDIRPCWDQYACRVHIGGGSAAKCGTLYVKKQVERFGYFECHTLFEQLYAIKH